jgi:hypothetical protein
MSAFAPASDDGLLMSAAELSRRIMSATPEELARAERRLAHITRPLAPNDPQARWRGQDVYGKHADARERSVPLELLSSRTTQTRPIDPGLESEIFRRLLFASLDVSRIATMRRQRRRSLVRRRDDYDVV